MTTQPRYIVRRTDTDEYDTGTEPLDRVAAWSPNLNEAMRWIHNHGAVHVQKACEELDIPTEIIDLVERYGVLL